MVIHGLKHTTLEVVELIIIEVYGSTVFRVVKDYIYNNTGADNKRIVDCHKFAYVDKYLPKLTYFTHK